MPQFIIRQALIIGFTAGTFVLGFHLGAVAAMAASLAAVWIAMSGQMVVHSESAKARMTTLPRNWLSDIGWPNWFTSRKSGAGLPRATSSADTIALKQSSRSCRRRIRSISLASEPLVGVAAANAEDETVLAGDLEVIDDTTAQITVDYYNDGLKSHQKVLLTQFSPMAAKFARAVGQNMMEFTGDAASVDPHPEEVSAPAAQAAVFHRTA